MATPSRDKRSSDRKTPEAPARDDRARKGGAPPPGKDGKPPPPAFGRGIFGWVTIIMMAALLGLWFSSQSAQQRTLKDFKEFETRYRNGELTDVVLQDQAITAIQKTPDGKGKQVSIPVSPKSREKAWDMLKELTGGRFRESPGPGMFLQILLNPFTLTILVMVVIYMIFLRGIRSLGSGAGMLGNFGKSKHRVLMKETTGVTFADVAGISEAKDEVREIIEFLKNPKKFTRLGGRVPRGVLLVGEPGCGKTLLAKAIAGEADVPFFSISGSDFVEMFVGVGASRVRDLFKQAKESSPCIIFLDEIDAVGRRRGSGFTTGGHDEREQTLNAILVEMDGFDTSDQVIVIAATNRSDVLDPALLRPGRFDRQVMVPLPDLTGRVEILKVHAKKVKLGPSVDLERIARLTPMFSGADLAAIINEAAISATMQEKEYIDQADLEEARDKVKYGRSRKSRVIEEEERIATAYHEAGHAVLQALLPGADPLHKVTIIPRGQALGATFSMPEKDRHGAGLKWLNATMRVVCGGRIAELKKTGDMSSGAAMDITQLTTLARAMALEWGMSDRLGFVRYAGTDTRESFIPEKEYSDETARIIDEEVKRYADEAYRDAEELLHQRWDAVTRVAEALLRHETLTADEVHRLIRGEELSKPTIGDLLAAEARKARQSASDRPRASEGGAEPSGPGLMPTPA